MKAERILPPILLVLILGPATARLLRREPPPPEPPAVLAPAPPPAEPAATPREWFDRLRPRCTPADVRLATDLTPPPDGTDGTGYEAACFALARHVPNARALLLGLAEEERARGAEVVYEVARGLEEEGHPEMAGPLMELVLEIRPDHVERDERLDEARHMVGELAAR